MAGYDSLERFWSLVNSICNHVLAGVYRINAKNQPLEDDHVEIPDKVLDLEGMLVTKQAAEQVRRILDGMPKRIATSARHYSWRRRKKDTVCKELGVDRSTLGYWSTGEGKFKRSMRKGRWGWRGRLLVGEPVKRYSFPRHYSSDGTNGP